MLNIFKPKCNCKYFWQQKLVEAKCMSMVNYTKKTLFDMGFTVVDYFFGNIIINVDDVCLLISDSIPSGFYANKYACVTCGTCLGWDVDDDKLRKNLKKEIERQQKINKEKHLAKRICGGKICNE